MLYELHKSGQVDLTNLISGYRPDTYEFLVKISKQNKFFHPQNNPISDKSQLVIST